MTPKPNSRECPPPYAHLPISSGLPSAKFDVMIEYTVTVLFTIILRSSSQLTTVEISHIVSISQFYSLSLFCTTDFLALFFYFPSSSALLGKKLHRLWFVLGSFFKANFLSWSLWSVKRVKLKSSSLPKIVGTSHCSIGHSPNPHYLLVASYASKH